LEVAIAAGQSAEAEGAVVGSEEISGFIEAVGADAATFEGIGGEIGNFLAEFADFDWIRGPGLGDGGRGGFAAQH
jgi:hypothetical protein